MSRPVCEIADEITVEWERVWFGAVPYLRAMSDLNSVDENYGCESGRSIVLYFLGNAQTWRGEAARRIKRELKELVK